MTSPDAAIRPHYPDMWQFFDPTRDSVSFALTHQAVSRITDPVDHLFMRMLPAIDAAARKTGDGEAADPVRAYTGVLEDLLTGCTALVTRVCTLVLTHLPAPPYETVAEMLQQALSAGAIRSPQDAAALIRETLALYLDRVRAVLPDLTDEELSVLSHGTEQPE